jgi:hypothetical protein
MTSLHSVSSGHKKLDRKSQKNLDGEIPEDLRRKRLIRGSYAVAAILGWHPQTLKQKWRNGEGPPLRRLGPRTLGSTVGDIEDYLEACKVT